MIAQGNALDYVIVRHRQVVGTRRRTFVKGSVVIEIELFRPLKEAEKAAVTSAAERYGTLTGLPRILTLQGMSFVTFLAFATTYG